MKPVISLDNSDFTSRDLSTNVSVNLKLLLTFDLTDMSCGNPPAITNGKLTFNGTKYNSTAHYTCNEGYSLNTIFPVKRCTAKKRWSGITPTCSEYRSSLTGFIKHLSRGNLL